LVSGTGLIIDLGLTAKFLMGFFFLKIML